jgi:DNA-binding NarL/FixJ family response regulator
MHERPPPAPSRLLVADGDPIVRAALRLLFARDPDFRVIAESANVDELRTDLTNLQPDLILLDMDLPGLTPGDLLSACRTTRAIALSTREEQRHAALVAGAEAFVCKSESPRQLLAALHSMSGGSGN